jgi:hypothetical protein
MKKASLLLATLVSITIVFTSCKKDPNDCTQEVEFCGFINAEEFDKTGTLMDRFLEGVATNLTDQEKLEKLIVWLECKNCVADAEIICKSCIYTFPAQSELKVRFIVNGQPTDKILDISMSEPLRFRSYHD